MIYRCLETRLFEEAFNYISEDYRTTPYLYINMMKYGITNPNVKIWIDREDAKPCGIYLQYYDCLHFFTKQNDTYSCERFLDMLSECKPKVFMVQSTFGDRIESSVSKAFQVEKNYTLDLQLSSHRKQDPRVQLAVREDIEKIAALMLADAGFKNIYTRDILVAQLKARYDDKFSRFFIIQQDGEIVAVYSSYGETDDMVLLNGLLVHPQYRRQGLAHTIIQHACYILGKEKETGISFVNYKNIASLELHKKVGVSFIGSMYKFVSRG